MPKKTKSSRCAKTKEHRRQKNQQKRVRSCAKATSQKRRRALQTRYAKQVRETIQWLLESVPDQGVEVHGNATWRQRKVITQMLLWMISEKRNTTDAFDSARNQCRRLDGTAPFSSYNGMMNVIVRYKQTLTESVMQQLRAKLHSLMGKQFFTAGWSVFAVDGSRGSTPRTVDNEKAFQSKTYGKGKTAKYRKKKTKGMRRQKNEKKPPAPPLPQIWMTTVQHINSGIPWAWELGPSNASERQHFQTMIAETSFPARTLFVGDAGFVGFDFWKSITEAEHHFLVRVGANVTLIEGLDVEDCGQGSERIVYCWPKSQQKRNAPLKLRLIEVELCGKPAMLLTNVLDESELTVDGALEIYKSRWGIEVGYRDLKQTLERRVLRSRKASRALAELNCSILAMAVLRVMALESHQTKGRRAKSRPAISFAGVLRTFRNVLEDLYDENLQEESLREQLRQCVHDEYERHGSKQSRYRNTKKDIPRCGVPVIERATKEVTKNYKEIQKALAC